MVGLQVVCVQVVMGDEVLEQKFNKSHIASTNPLGMGREKSLRYDPPVRCQVRVGLRTPVSTRKIVWVCECRGWVSMIQKVEFIQFRPHRHHHMDMLVDTLLWTCMSTCATRIFRGTHFPPIPAYSPLTLSLLHYLTLIKYV